MLSPAPAAAPPRKRSKPPEISPATRRPLQPGQRNPTPFDEHGAWSGDGSSPAGVFPDSAHWEVTAPHAETWLKHGFFARRGDTNRMRQLGDLSEDEFAMLLWDLDLYEGLWRRWVARNGLLARELQEPRPPHIVDYLRPGREEWGWIGAYARELGWLE
jgi:hypothetical protein